MVLLNRVEPSSITVGKYTSATLNSSVKGFIPNSVIVRANSESSSMITVAAFQENVSSVSTGSKF